MSPDLAKLLRVARFKHEVVHHNDHFPESTTDEDWLLKINDWSPRPFVWTGDARILTNPSEKAVVCETQLSFICSPKWMNITWLQFCIVALKALPELEKRCAKIKKPTILDVTAKAKVNVRGLVSELLHKKK